MTAVQMRYQIIAHDTLFMPAKQIPSIFLSVS
jgi:hypothetical protein